MGQALRLPPPQLSPSLKKHGAFADKLVKVLKTSKQADGYLKNLHRFPSGYFTRLNFVCEEKPNDYSWANQKLTYLGKIFPADVLNHIATCAEKCGSYEVFSSVIKQVEKPDSKVLHAALDCLDNGLNEKGKDRWKHLREGLFEVQLKICKLSDELSRQQLSLRAIDLGTGAIKLKRSYEKSTQRTVQMFTSQPIIMRKLTLKMIEQIHQHSEERVQGFYMVCVVVYNDGYEYCVGDTFSQSGKGEKEKKTEAAHPHILPSLNRRRLGHRWYRAKFDEVFPGTDLFKRLNVTTVLPKECNKVDTWVEGKRGEGKLRDQASVLLNRVANNDDKFTPAEACKEFAGHLWDRLDDYLEREDGDKLPELGVAYAELQKEIVYQFYKKTGDVMQKFVKWFASQELGDSSQVLKDGGDELLRALRRS